MKDLVSELSWPSTWSFVWSTSQGDRAFSHHFWHRRSRTLVWGVATGSFCLLEMWPVSMGKFDLEQGPARGGCLWLRFRCFIELGSLR